MKSKPALVLAAVVTAAVLYHLIQPYDLPAPGSRTRIGAADAMTGSAVAPASRPEPIDKPVTVASSTDAPMPPPAEEVETETVFGIEVRKDRNCDVRQRYRLNDDGTLTELFSCEPREEQYSPYDAYTLEMLEQLAYSDWQASLELGKRLIGQDPKRATQFLLRSLALDSADPNRSTRLYPLRIIVTQRFRGDATGQSDLRAISNMHLYHSLGRLLDPSYSVYAADSRQMLIDAGASQTVIEDIEARSERLYEDLNEIRQEIIGESWDREERI